MQIIGITGGSGAGKSSVAYALVDQDPARFEVLNFDDYQKERSEPDLPTMYGMVNWDHPDIIDWDALISDLQMLKRGKTITIRTWAHRSNADYWQTGKRIPRTVYPHPVLILEGYLVLHKPELRQLLDKTIYFELAEARRLKRRTKNHLVGQDAYMDKVLPVMHAKYVAPTKSKADVVIHVGDKTIADVVREVTKCI